jgi:hypothetical protein
LFLRAHSLRNELPAARPAIIPYQTHGYPIQTRRIRLSKYLVRNEQANNSYAGYGQGAAGYSKRFAAKFVDGRSSDLLTHAVFPSLLHQDPRYYYQGSGSVSRFTRK